jgi:hypothetical protein
MRASWWFELTLIHRVPTERARLLGCDAEDKQDGENGKKESKLHDQLLGSAKKSILQ